MLDNALQSQTLLNRPRLVVVSENPAQRLALSEAVKACGYDLVDCVTPLRLNTVLSKHVDLWLIDCEDDVSIIQKLKENHSYLLGFTPSPNITDIKAFDKWQRHLKRKLTHVFDGATYDRVDAKPKKTWFKRDWRMLVIMGASMGGPSAVKDFLDNLPSDMPVALVLAHHGDPIAIGKLPDILTRHNQWQCSVLEGQQYLKAGKVWVIPPSKDIVFSRNGSITLTEQDDKTKYKPSISQAMLNASNEFMKDVRCLIFSGMGDDGSDVAEKVVKNGAEIWIQSLETCECDSQPSAMYQTNQIEYIGNPEDLAQHLMSEVDDLPSLGFT